MEACLAAADLVVSDLTEIDIAVLDATQLASGVLHLQKIIDRLRVVQARWLTEADRLRIWAPSGHRDIAAWLAANGKTSVGTAKKQTKLAAAIGTSPELADAVGAGEISPDTAEALQPTLAGDHSGNAGELVQACKGATPAQARHAGDVFRELHPPAGTTDKDREQLLRQKRSLRFTDIGDGTTRIDGVLPTLDARIVRDALSAITGKPRPGDDRTFDQKMADSLVQLCQAYAAGDVTGGRNRPTILITIDINDLNGHTNGPGYTSKGDVIPAQAVRNMCPNATIARILLNDSMPLDLGRSERFATDAQWRALVARDGGCRGIHCHMPPEWCQVDHIREWVADRGDTNIDELVLFCNYCHHFRHRPDVRLHGDGNNLSIELPDGTIIPLPARGPTHTKRPKPEPAGEADDPRKTTLFDDEAA